VFQQPGFELGDAAVGEPVVGAGGLQSFLQGSVLLGELADALLERGVLGGDRLRGPLGPLVFQVADLAHQDRDPLSLGTDLSVGCLQSGLCVEGAFPPRCLLLGAGLGLGLSSLPAALLMPSATSALASAFS
jgi:hypothetical protein